MEMGLGLFLETLETQGLQESLQEGIKAAVRLHYKEYTDQTELWGPFREALETVLYHVYAPGYEVEEIVREVEAEINAEGGIRSDSDGKRHPVQTFEPEDDE